MERRFSYLLAFVWTFFATVVFIVGMELSRAIRPNVVTDLVTLGAWDALGFAIASAVVLKLYVRSRAGPESLGIRATHPWLSVLGLLLGITLHGPADSLQKLAEWWSPLTEQDLLARTAMFSGMSATRAAGIVFVVGCVAPLMEELFFRGALFGVLRRRHAATGTIVVTSLCFVVSHQDLRMWGPVALAGLVLGVLRHNSGSVLPCLALHVGFNAVMLAPVVSHMVPAHEGLSLEAPAVFAGWVLSGLFLFVAYRVAGNSEQAQRARTQDEGGYG